MERNIQYLYEYQDGKRVRNIGFMKIERQMDQCLIQIHAKQVDDVMGIIFQKENGERYVGGWEEELLPVEEQHEPQEKPQEQPQEEQREPQNESEKQDEPQIEQKEVQVELGEMHEFELSEVEEIEEYIPPSDVVYEKIKRQDISRFPRKEWRLANNSFLLHGYYNYHHLLYIEDDGKIWIGVPGIYHEKEKMAANAFGFTEFRRLTDVEIDLDENEKNTYEDFGYWCRQIPVS